MVEKHTAAFRDRCVGRARYANKIELVALSLSPLCLSAWLYGYMAAKSGMCGMCVPSSPLLNPARFEACLGWAPLYATVLLNFSSSSPMRRSLPCYFTVDQPSPSYCTHRHAHPDPLALARA